MHPKGCKPLGCIFICGCLLYNYFCYQLSFINRQSMIAPTYNSCCEAYRFLNPLSASQTPPLTIKGG